MKRTENGALGYESTQHILLDMLFKLPSYRNDVESLKREYAIALKENTDLALKFAFYVGDIREGLGERKAFITMLQMLGEMEPTIVENVIRYIPEYNRWKTLFDAFIEPYVIERKGKLQVITMVVEYIQGQLNEDIKRYYDNRPISLLAKWMPSLTASNKQQRHIAGWLRRQLKYSPVLYRSTLKMLRSYIGIVESKMCDDKWGEIDYAHVPAKANLNYKEAFLKHDFNRRATYLGDVASGKQEMKAKVLYPCEIVHKYMSNSVYCYNAIKLDTTLELAWQNLKDISLNDESFKCLVVMDGSGSMYGRIGGDTSMLAITVAHSLAIYCSERLSGSFKDKFITFSAMPRLVDISEGKTLLEKIRICEKFDEVSNTNLERTFDLILETAVLNHLSQEELPSHIMIISDMEFDYATSTTVDETLMQTIEKKFKDAGYQLPKLIFWNVNSRTNTIPIRENELGVTLVGGYSINLLQMVLSQKLDPYENLLDILNGERYKVIHA